MAKLYAFSYICNYANWSQHVLSFWKYLDTLSYTELRAKPPLSYSIASVMFLLFADL